MIPAPLITPKGGGPLVEPGFPVRLAIYAINDKVSHVPLDRKFAIIPYADDILL
jgi:hypothetical protein